MSGDFISQYGDTHFLPENLRDYEQQIAGHGTEVERSVSEKFLKGDDGCIFKPIQPYPKGDKEVKFYRRVFSSETDNHTDYQQLRALVPAFHGVYGRSKDSKMFYIKLEDALSTLHKPHAMMDIKIGAKSYEPTASQAKIDEETKKYAWRHITGFLVCGMRTLNESGEYDFLNRKHWRTIGPDEIVKECLLVFLRSSTPASEQAKRLAKSFSARLCEIRKFFERQRLYHFYSSSLLFGYDETGIVLKVIDFAHALRCGTEVEDGVDENYLIGVNKLIEYFEVIANL